MSGLGVGQGSPSAAADSEASGVPSVIGDFTKRDESCCAGTAIAIGGTRGYIDSLSDDEGTASVVDPDGRQAWANRPMGQEISDGGVSLQTEQYTPSPW